MVLASHMVNLSLGNADLLASRARHHRVAPGMESSGASYENSTVSNFADLLTDSEIWEPYSAFFSRSWRPGLLSISQSMTMVARRSRLV